MKVRTILTLVILGISGLSADAQFIESQDEAGIQHVSRHLSFMGGGAAFFDYDRDGDDDLYITAGQAEDHFYINQGDGTFRRDTTAGFAVTGTYYTTGVIAGDIDNDGYKDVFVSTWGTATMEFAKNLLFHNNGDGTFTEIWSFTDPADLAFAMGATFFDYDLDGLLDIYVINYVERVEFVWDNDGKIIGFNHDCFANTFYKNLGGGNFVRYTSETGLGDTGCALAVTASDYDHDHLPDVYIANDFGPFIQPNKLYRNRTSGVYQNVSAQTGAGVAMYGMGIAIGDYDKDLDLDYYITDFGKNVLLRNQGAVGFLDISAHAGVEDKWSLKDSLLAIGWGTAFFDADLDTDLDLFICNGYVPSPDFLPSQIFQNDRFYLNNDDGTFTDATDAWGVSNLFTSRGMAYSDYDNDGDIDALSVVLNVPVPLGTWETKLHRNTTDGARNWCQLRLEGVSINRDAYGSKVYLYASDQVLMREVSGGASHGSMHSSRVYFGLNTLTHIDSIKIEWTGGKRIQTLYNPPINQIIDVQEDTTLPTPLPPELSLSSKISVFPVPAGQKLHFQSEDKNLEISSILLFDPQGMLRGTYQSPQSNEIELPHLADGTYILQLITSRGVAVERLVILQQY